MTIPLDDPSWKEVLKREEEVSDLIARGKKRQIHLCHPGTDHLYSKIYDRIGELAGHGHESVLDIGCGFGDFLRLSDQAERLYGIDISQERVNLARQRLQGRNASVLRGIAENLPYQSGSIDFAIMQSTLHHLKYPCLALREVRRVLKDDGVFVLVEGADDRWYRKIVHAGFSLVQRSYEASQFEHHSRRAIEEMLNHNNFSITHRKDVSIPFAWLARIGWGGEEVWRGLRAIDTYIPELFPWYHMFICEKETYDQFSH